MHAVTLVFIGGVWIFKYHWIKLNGEHLNNGICDSNILYLVFRLFSTFGAEILQSAACHVPRSLSCSMPCKLAPHFVIWCKRRTERIINGPDTVTDFASMSASALLHALAVTLPISKCLTSSKWCSVPTTADPHSSNDGYMWSSNQVMWCAVCTFVCCTGWPYYNWLP